MFDNDGAGDLPRMRYEMHLRVQVRDLLMRSSFVDLKVAQQPRQSEHQRRQKYSHEAMPFWNVICLIQA